MGKFIKGKTTKLDIMKIEETYIEYLNKDKNFQEDKKVFKGKDAYEQAVKWGRENLENFNMDMVKFDINPKINVGKLSSTELNEHYNFSKANYDIGGGESHLEFYRDKYPEHYDRLLKISENLKKLSPKKKNNNIGLKP